MTEWEELARWWVDDGVDDPVYREDVIPMLLALAGDSGGWALDLGCGEGHLMEHVPADVVIGCDMTTHLLRHARRRGPVVRCRLPELGWLRTASIDLAYAVFVLEHLADADTLFAEVRRVVRPGGAFVVIANHPAYTAAGAGPVIDQTDGEVLWRWGPYFAAGSSREPVGGGEVTYHHRPMSSLLTAAASAGWRLDRVDERGLGPAAISREPAYAGQEHMPRLLGVRWSAE